jgi:dipeptidase
MASRTCPRAFPVPRLAPPLSCDTLVALAPATADGRTIFGKNSDRHPRECQRIVLAPAAAHPPGAVVRCQYVELPQVRHTARVLGAQPYWLWGFEHGVNEHGVAIGNEMVATREAVPAVGLLGMDLVRLGLERARSAGEAVDVITTLVEAHGQGGSGQPHVDWGYHNSFLVCDHTAAWILETSGRHFAARAVATTANISNHLSIGTDWDRLDAGATAFAVAEGWWRPGDGRLDFAGAYRDVETFPRAISEGRYCRAAALLGETRGRMTLAAMCAILRDHHGSPIVRGGRDPADPDYFSLCMHAGELMGTTGSMVVALAADTPPVAWMALGNPCVSLYLPFYLEADIPAAVGRGGREPSSDSLWWAFHDLGARVEADPDRFGVEVRAYWDALEREIAERARQVEARVVDLRARGDRAGASALLTDFMERNLRAMAAGVRALAARAVAGRGDGSPRRDAGGEATRG